VCESVSGVHIWIAISTWRGGEHICAVWCRLQSRLRTGGGEVFRCLVEWSDADMILSSILQDNKADVIDKYLPDEVRALKTAGELPDSVKLNETEEGGEDNFEFGSGGEEEESGDESDKSDKDEDIDDI